MAQAGPWGRRFALPALAAFGVRWLGPESAEDTVFRNRSAGGGCWPGPGRSGPPTCRRNGRGRGGVAAVPGGCGAGVVERLRAAGPFLGLDLQGWLRAVDAKGRVRARRFGGIEAIRAVAAGVQVVKFSAHEFHVWGRRTTGGRRPARQPGHWGRRCWSHAARPGRLRRRAACGGCSTAAAPATYFWPPTCGRAMAGPGRWRRWRRRRGWRSDCCGGGPTERPVCRWPI